MIDSNVNLATVMSQAVAPVFLITGVSGLIASQGTRFGRVIDRTRTLLREGDKLYPGQNSYVINELKALYIRAKILRTAIICAAISIFFIANTVLMSFFSFWHDLELQLASELSFVASLVFVMLSVAFFIRDFMIGLRSIAFDIKARSDYEVG